jgi:branched-chain amino acid transport system substrate-binding protein
MRLRYTAVATLVLLAAVGTTSLAFGSVGSSKTLKIGVPVPLSGDYASAGQDILRGAQLAAQKINAAGGVAGFKIKIMGADDACSAQTAAQAAQKLISQGINIAVGGYCSSASLPELQAFHRVGIPYVLDASTNPQLTEQGFPEVFRTIGRDDKQGPFAASFIAGFLHGKRVAVGNDNTTYSKGLADNTVAALKSAGVDVVFNDALTPGQSDYTSYLTKVGQAKPDVFYYTGYFAEMGLLIKQAQQLGLTFHMVGGDACNDNTLIKTAGSAAEGVLVTTAPIPQFLASAKGFLAAYTKGYHTSPGPYSMYEYDGVGVVAKVIAKIKTTNAKKVEKALHLVKLYHGVSGDFRFDNHGDRSPAVYIVIIVKNGGFVAYRQFKNGNWVPA